MGKISLLELVLQADWVVKLVLLLLFIGSIAGWTIIFSKITSLKAQIKKADNFEKQFWKAQALEKLYEQARAEKDNPMANIFLAGIKELKLNLKTENNSQEDLLIRTNDIINNAMKVECNRIIDRLEKHIDILATIAGAAPFIGLFGTVWGIIVSFQNIAGAKSATLEIVAPGIAEALLATAAGLVVAIPAVIFYNYISTAINRFSLRLENFVSELFSLLSRKG